MTTMDASERVNALKAFVPVGALLTLLTMAVGGAFFAAKLSNSVDQAIEEIVEVKEGVQSLRRDVQAQGNLVSLLQQQQTNLTRATETHRNDIEKLRERIHQIELDLREKR